jgi:hypothetical protein
LRRLYGAGAGWLADSGACLTAIAMRNAKAPICASHSAVNPSAAITVVVVIQDAALNALKVKASA